MDWRKSRAIHSARSELFLILPPEREVAFEKALELLRAEDIVRWAGTERKMSPQQTVNGSENAEECKNVEQTGQRNQQAGKSSVNDCFVLISRLCACSHTRARRMGALWFLRCRGGCWRRRCWFVSSSWGGGPSFRHSGGPARPLKQTRRCPQCVVHVETCIQSLVAQVQDFRAQNLELQRSQQVPSQAVDSTAGISQYY